MPWLNVRPMDSKIFFLSDWLRGFDSFSATCSRHGISRKTGYKWVQRYKALGFDGLKEQSRRPNHIPNRIPFAISQALIALRKQHPHWGLRSFCRYWPAGIRTGSCPARQRFITSCDRQA